MNREEYMKCQGAAKLFRQQQHQIQQLKAEIAALKEQLAWIDEQDREVIAIVRINHRRKH